MDWVLQMPFFGVTSRQAPMVQWLGFPTVYRTARVRISVGALFILASFKASVPPHRSGNVLFVLSSLKEDLRPLDAEWNAMGVVVLIK